MESSERTKARIEEAAARVAALLADGLQVEDAAALVREAVEVAEAAGEFDALSGDVKRALALDLLDRFLRLAEPAVDAFVARVVDETDGPGPDWLVDPIAKRMAPEIVVGTIRAIAPKLIDLLVAATHGEVAVNVEGE